MTTLTIEQAYYIKLGQGGEWEENSIGTSVLRLGWGGQSLDDINAGRWDTIWEQLYAVTGDKGEATRDCNRLRNITESPASAVWITFHAAKMWWTCLSHGPVESDGISKFRRTTGWRDRNLADKVLFANELPGQLAATQAFRATSCSVEPELLQRVLNGHQSPFAIDISCARAALVKSLAGAITQLHWKDFETLADLVFRQAGWIRQSVLGQQARALDLELLEPLTRSKYVVQVKSRAGVKELEQTIASFDRNDFRRIYFVVHSPTEALRNFDALPEHVELLLPERLGELALEAGLTHWIEGKVA